MAHAEETGQAEDLALVRLETDVVARGGQSGPRPLERDDRA